MGESAQSRTTTSIVDECEEEGEDSFDQDSVRGSSPAAGGSAPNGYGETNGSGRPKRMRRHSIAY